MTKRIYCGNLPFLVSQDDVRAMFATHGEVTDVHVVIDRDTGRSRGFAFVEMATEEQAKSAIETLNGHSIDGRSLKVTEAQPREPRGAPSGFGQDRARAESTRRA